MLKIAKLRKTLTIGSERKSVLIYPKSSRLGNPRKLFFSERKFTQKQFPGEQNQVSKRKKGVKGVQKINKVAESLF